MHALVHFEAFSIAITKEDMRAHGLETACIIIAPRKEDWPIRKMQFMLIKGKKILKISSYYCN